MSKFDPAALFPATAMPDAAWWRTLWPRPGQVLRKVCIRPGMEVVDLCCGDGLFTAALSKMLDGRVTGVDIDPAMLTRAKRHLNRSGAPACNWLQADARHLSVLLDHKVDAVFLANTFHGIPEQENMLRDLRTILKPGGLLAIINWHAHPREETTVLGTPRGPASEMRMTPVETSKLVERAGFALETVAELPPYHYGAVFRRG